MASSWSIGIVVVAAFISLSSSLSAADTGAKEAPGVVVAVLEPRAPKGKAHELGFSVSVGNSRFVTLQEVLDGLGEPGASKRHLAIFAREDLPMSAIMDFSVIAGKIGYARLGVFAFDKARTVMVQLPSFKQFNFSTDPAIVGPLFPDPLSP